MAPCHAKAYGVNRGDDAAIAVLGEAIGDFADADLPPTVLHERLIDTVDHHIGPEPLNDHRFGIVADPIVELGKRCSCDQKEWPGVGEAERFGTVTAVIG